MCWVSKKTPQRKIAEKDIKIFKICILSDIVGEVNSIYKHFHYILGKHYIQIVPLEAEECSIYRGYHSYSEEVVMCNQGRSLVILSKDSVQLEYINLNPTVVKVLGHIPKNAEYYINEWGECVSSEICLTDIEQLYVLENYK